MTKRNSVDMIGFIKNTKAKHDALDFIKQSNELLTEHDFYDAAISHSSLLEENDISRDEIVLGFDGLEPTVTLSKNDIKTLALAVGLKVIK